MESYKILILDDHPLIIEGIKHILPDYDITACSNCSDIVLNVKNNNYNLIILDYELNGCTALDVIPVIRKNNDNIPIVVYTMHSEPWIISSLINLDINGVIIKDDPMNEIVDCIDKVIVKKQYYYSATAIKILLCINGNNNLKNELTYVPSPRELEIIILLSKGLTSEEISNNLNLAKTTVDTVRKNILLKSGAKNVSQLMRFAFINGWIKS